MSPVAGCRYANTVNRQRGQLFPTSFVGKIISPYMIHNGFGVLQLQAYTSTKKEDSTRIHTIKSLMPLPMWWCDHTEKKYIGDFDIAIWYSHAVELSSSISISIPNFYRLLFWLSTLRRIFNPGGMSRFWPKSIPSFSCNSPRFDRLE